MKAFVTRTLLLAIGSRVAQGAAPTGFPTSGNGLWFNKPALVWAEEYLPISNGYLAAMIPGGTFQEFSQLNIESLWSGGPFHDPSYNGGNKQPSERPAMATAMQKIRDGIWANGTVPDVNVLTTDAGSGYGSYSAAGYLISTLNITPTAVTDYSRWLDLDVGVATTAFGVNGQDYKRESFCSHPLKSCVEHTTASSKLPAVTYAFGVHLEAGLLLTGISCLNNTTLRVQGFADSPGMAWEILGRVQATGSSVSCTAIDGSNPANATIVVSQGASESWITWVGDTEFDQDKGTAAAGFSFKGADPHDELVLSSQVASSSSYASIRQQHVSDHQALFGGFSLNIGQTPDLSRPTNELKADYTTPAGSPYLEWLIFNFGRYLLGVSARGDLPANLQGKWALGYANPWGADYHSNINIQMNYWCAEITGLDVTKPLFDYFEKNWAPRGAQTAEVLYNITRGWVVHNEMNIFGHSGMKSGGASFGDYTEAAVWMMDHVWDHFDYTNDIEWWKRQGWPLVKGVASFHLDKLIPDLRFNDGSLVVSPCNSPEQNPITLGCAHSQQLIYQLFNTIEKGFAASGDTDGEFLKEVQAKRAKMDKGIRIGSWGQLQEWKIDMDSPDDKHRHLSHLIGLYPGYAIASYDSELQGGIMVNGTVKTYTKAEVLEATQTSLIARGPGAGPDADSGWEKAWRAAAWAQLGNAQKFYDALTYTASRNLGPNLMSLYNPGDPDPIFQIDANLGFPGALMNALIQAPDVPTSSTPLIITILPALPSAWSSGSIKGARVRGGIQVNFEWSGGKPTRASFSVAQSARSDRQVRVVYAGNTVSSFTTSPGSTKVVNF